MSLTVAAESPSNRACQGAPDGDKPRRVRDGRPYPRRMPDDLRSTLARRVVIADGAMGTMLQGYDLTMADFDQLEGCNEVLNRTRPDIVRAIHDAYFEVGVDAVETNTFGTNLSALGEYGISEQIFDLAERAARIARESADAYSTADRPGGCSAASGPGRSCRPWATSRTRQLRDAYQTQVEGMLAGGIDAVLIETSQDLLQTKAATLGAKRALAPPGATCRSSCTSRSRPPAPCCSVRRSAPPSPRWSRSDRPDRAELRHRSGRDERAPAASVPVRADRGQLHAQRRAAAADRRTARTTR